MATKTITNLPDPDDPELVTGGQTVDINIAAQEFSVDYSALENEEEVTQKTIAYLEKLIRKSYEYKQYIQYLKEELDITKCALIPSLNQSELNFSLEFHHYPMTLYDIVDAVVRKKLVTKDENQKISMFDVMQDVMEEHYSGNVGLVPLSSTLHEMAHNDSVRIPISSVYGSFPVFISKYRQFIPLETQDKITRALAIGEEDAAKFNTKLEKTVLNYKVTYNKDDNEK